MEERTNKKAFRCEGPKNEGTKLSENLNDSQITFETDEARQLRSPPYLAEPVPPRRSRLKHWELNERKTGICGTYDRKQCTKN